MHTFFGDLNGIDSFVQAPRQFLNSVGYFVKMDFLRFAVSFCDKHCVGVFGLGYIDFCSRC